MNSLSSPDELLIIGLGGFGVKASIALRSEIEAKRSEWPSSNFGISLLALDLANFYSEYFGEATGLTPSESTFLKSEEQFVLNQVVHSLDDAWEKVRQSAEEDDSFALSFAQKRRTRIGMEAPFPTDLLAVIFSASGALEHQLKNRLQKIQNSSGSQTRTRVIVVTSLLGDTGSQAYIPVLRILSKLAAEFPIGSVSSLLLDPEVFKNTSWRQNRHLNRSALCLWNIQNQLKNEPISGITLNQYLVSQDIEMQLPAKVLLESEVRRSLASEVSRILVTNGIPALDSQDSLISNGNEQSGGHSQIQIVQLTQDKFLEARELLKKLPEYEQRWLRDNY